MYLCWCLFASKSVTRLLRQIFFSHYFSAVPFTVRLNYLLRELIWFGVTCCLQKRCCIDQFTDAESNQDEIDYLMSVPLGRKVHLSPKIFKLFLASQLVLLSGDVMLKQ